VIKIVKTLTSSLILSCLTVIPAQADAPSPCYTVDDSGVVTDDNACTGSVVIDDSVTSIGISAFANNTNLTSVIIGDSVTSIGDYAFYNNTALTSVTIGKSVATIGIEAFINNTSLISVTFSSPSKVETIGQNAFAGNTALTSVTIPNSVTTIADYAFAGNTALTSVSIPNSVTTIGQWAFYNNIELTSVTIPNSVTTIGPNAFYNNFALTSVIIGDSVTAIGNSAFFDNTALASVTIGRSVTDIGGSAFWNNRALKSLRFLGSAPTIGDSAFVGLHDSATAYVLNSFASTFTDTVTVGEVTRWQGLIFSPGDAPAFTLSSTSEVKTVNNPISGYTIDTSTGGAVASYSISPAAPPGLTFDTSTGLLAGTPTQVAAATTYTITATNSWGSATSTFTLTVNEVPSSGGGGGAGGGVVIDRESLQALFAAQEKAAAETLAAEKAAAEKLAAEKVAEEKLAAEKAAAEKLAAEKAEIGIEIGIQSTTSNIFQPRVASLGSNQVRATQVKLLVGNSISPTLRGLGKKELVTVSLSKDGRRFSLGNLKTTSRGELKLPPITLFKTGTYLVRITSADTKTRFLKVLVTAKKN